MLKRWLPVLMILFGVAAGAGAWSGHAQQPRLDVFVEQDPASGAARIYFLDPLSGLSTVVDVSSGQQFTLISDYVMYEKPQNGAVMRANADGSLEPHPFIRRTPDLRALRWVVSADRQSIAWVQVDAAGVSSAYAAQADGRDLRQLPIVRPDTAAELSPVALANGMAYFFYDSAYPLDSQAAPFPTFTALEEYSILDETFLPLPGEPNCACGAAFTPDGRIFARLESDSGSGPYNLRVWDLLAAADIAIPAPDLAYPLAGDLIINPAGTFAAYSVATADPAAPQYALVLVDVVAKQQYLVLAPGPARYRPLAFLDDDGELLLDGVTAPGTYKLNLVSGELRQVSRLAYLGTISGG